MKKSKVDFEEIKQKALNDTDSNKRHWEKVLKRLKENPPPKPKKKKAKTP